jgi:hypothetical protein
MTDDWHDIDSLTAITIIRELVGEARTFPGFTCRLGTPPTPTGELLIQFSSGIELNWSPPSFGVRHNAALAYDWQSAPCITKGRGVETVREQAQRVVREVVGSQCDMIDPLSGIMHEPELFRCRARCPSSLHCRDACRLYDVPPWLALDEPRPRFARLCFALRRIWPALAWLR